MICCIQYSCIFFNCVLNALSSYNKSMFTLHFPFALWQNDNEGEKRVIYMGKQFELLLAELAIGCWKVAAAAGSTSLENVCVFYSIQIRLWIVTLGAVNNNNLNSTSTVAGQHKKCSSTSINVNGFLLNWLLHSICIDLSSTCVCLNGCTQFWNYNQFTLTHTHNTIQFDRYLL